MKATGVAAEGSKELLLMDNGSLYARFLGSDWKKCKLPKGAVVSEGQGLYAPRKLFTRVLVALLLRFKNEEAMRELIKSRLKIDPDSLDDPSERRALRKEVYKKGTRSLLKLVLKVVAGR